MYVWINALSHYPGQHEYAVMVNAEKYDEFVSRKKLRRDDMRDIAAGYKEALNEYVPSSTRL